MNKKAVAIIGFDCVVRGAHDPYTFWRNLKENVNPIKYREINSYPNCHLHNCNYKYGLLDRIAYFNPGKYCLSEEEAIFLDPQHRIFLDLFDRSIDSFNLRNQFSDTNSSVYIGISSFDYSNLLNRYALKKRISPYIVIGNAHSILSGRIAYLLNSKGPNEVVDTACASSLSAVYRAYCDIIAGTTQQAIAGGVNLILDDCVTESLQKLGILSTDFSTKVFHKDANGYVRSEGAVIFYLKRLDKALADGNTVFATIDGGATNHNGKSCSLTSPNPSAQRELITTALKSAKLTAKDINYLECHGTGTVIGDKLEISVINETLVKNKREKPLLIGSVKSNIGHMEAASGGAGLIKVLLAFYYGEIPSNKHTGNLLDLIENNPLLNVCQRTYPIKAHNRPPIFLINSFGFSGTNCSLVIKANTQVNDHNFEHGQLNYSKNNYWFEHKKNILKDSYTKSSSYEDISNKISKILYHDFHIKLTEKEYSIKLVNLDIDSISLIAILSKIEKKFQVNINVSYIINSASTYGDLVNHIKNAIGKKIPGNTQKNPVGYSEEKTLLTKNNTDSLADNLVLKHQIELYLQKTKTSKRLSEQSKQVLVDSISMVDYSPLLKSVSYPLTLEKAVGSHVYDCDGNVYIDCMLEYGANLFGHGVLQASDKVHLPLGAPKKDAEYVARKICALTQHERVALVTTGSEAIMNSIRIARAYTNKNKIAIFSWSYHGSQDQVLCAPTTGENIYAQPLTLGIPQENLANTMIFEYGTPQSLELIKNHLEEIAAIIVQPIQSRRPHIQPYAFLAQLREICDGESTLLIFDEVINGFRLAKGEAGAIFRVKPDLAIYGKIIAGGLPLAAVAGRRKLLAIADGGCFEYTNTSQTPTAIKAIIAGTYNECQASLALAKSTMDKLELLTSVDYDNLNRNTEKMSRTINEFLSKESIKIECQFFGSIFRFKSSKNISLFYFILKLNGLYVSPVRNCFISFSHTENDIEKIIEIIKKSAITFKKIYKNSLDHSFEHIYPISKNKKGKVLLCFKFVAGTLDSYIPIVTGLEDHYDFFYIEYNTENFFSEEVRIIANKIQEKFASQDLYFLGHSMGALMAYSVAITLQNMFHRSINYLIVSAERAPNDSYSEYKALSKKDLNQAIIAFLEAADPQLTQKIVHNKVMHNHVVDYIRKDIKFFFTQEVSMVAKLDTPIVALRAEFDNLVNKIHIVKWKEFTSKNFINYKLRNTNHDYFTKKSTFINRIIKKILAINLLPENSNVR